MDISSDISDAVKAEKSKQVLGDSIIAEPIAPENQGREAAESNTALNLCYPFWTAGVATPVVLIR